MHNFRSNTVQQVTVASDPSLSRRFREERTHREERVAGRRFPMDIPIPVESQSSRSSDSNRNLWLSSALAGRSRRRVLETKQSLNWEESSRNELKDAIEVVDTPRLNRRILGPTEMTQGELQSIVNSIEMEDGSVPLDRRRLGRQLRPLRQQGGIAGVAYDDIYLAIGVAATALFIIETLYKTYQLYNSAGRSLEDTPINLIEAWPWPS